MYAVAVRIYLRSLAVALVAAAAVSISSAPAAAHAVLLESRPADGERLQTSPEAIVLRFNEPVTPIRVRVLDRGGHERTKVQAAKVHGNDIRIGLSGLLPDGGYMVSYRVTSADSHPVAGTILFSVGTSAESTGRSAASSDASASPWSTAARANRAVHYAALLLAVGGGLFLLSVARGGGTEDTVVRRWAYGAIGVAVASALLSVGLQGSVLLGSDAFDLQVWKAGVHSTAGPATALFMLGAAILACGLHAQANGAGKFLIGTGAALALGSLVVTGHAATASPRWLMSPAVYFHTATAAFWAGSLIPLLIVLSRRRAIEAAPVVERFSRLAVMAVAILVLGGSVLAVRQIGSMEALLSTAYGATFLLKLGLVATLLGIAGYNKYRLTPALAAGDEIARLRLMRSVRIELGLFAAIVAVTATLGATVPPRAEPRHSETSQLRVAVAGSYRATIEVVSSGRSGHAVTVRFYGKDGGSLDPKEVVGTFALPEAGVEPIARPFVRIAPGAFRHTGMPLVPAGRWGIALDALIGDFEKATFAADFDVR